VLADADPRARAFVLAVQFSHAIVLCAIFLALRFRARDRRRPTTRNLGQQLAALEGIRG
jgi:hypothetical protein